MGPRWIIWDAQEMFEKWDRFIAGGFRAGLRQHPSPEFVGFEFVSSIVTDRARSLFGQTRHCLAIGQSDCGLIAQRESRPLFDCFRNPAFASSRTVAKLARAPIWSPPR